MDVKYFRNFLMPFFGFTVPKILLPMFIFNTPEIIFMLSSKRRRVLASAMSHVHEILDKKTYLCNSNHKKQYSNDVTNLEMKILTRWSKV